MESHAEEVGWSSRSSGGARALTQRTTALTLAIAGVLTACEARAAAPAVSAGLYGMYGYSLAGRTPVDPFGPGLGLQAGVSLGGSGYIGGALQHFFGVEVGESLLLAAPMISMDRTGSQNRALALAGYDWRLGAATLRPSIGLGYSLQVVALDYRSGSTVTESSSTRHGFVISPGIEARLPWGPISLCGELRNDTVLAHGAIHDALVGSVGVGVDL